MKFIFVLIILGLSGCGYSRTSIPGQAGDLDSRSEEGNSEVDLNFANIKVQVFEPYCLSCHSNATRNADGVNLETYEAVSLNIASIRQAVVSGFMPRNSTLPDRQKQLLIAWIDAGASEFGSGEIDPSTNPNPGKPTPPQSSPGCDDDNDNDDDNSASRQDQQIGQIKYYFDRVNNEFVFHENRRGKDRCHNSKGE